MFGKKVKKVISLLMAAVLAAGLLSGCARGQKQADNGAAGTEQTAAITVTDQAGREVTLEKPAENIVSSYYISTALLIALGCEDKLTGIERKADTRELYKLAAPQLLSLPAVGSGKGINIEETAALAPDVVILPARLKDNVTALEELNIPVVIVNPETQEDFEACVTLLAQITGTDKRGEELLTYYHQKMDEAKTLTEGLDKPVVYMAAGADYLRTCTPGMYQHDLISMAGGQNAAAELTQGYWQDVSPEQVLAFNPDYIFAVNYAEYSLADIREDEALSEITAVKEGRIFTFPSRIEAWDYPTPSSVLGVLWLTCQLHPEVYSREQYIREAKEFYQTYFDITVTEEQLGL